MLHFVTLFDSLYLPQGLNLYQSMQRHLDSFTLWILCIDDVTFDVLDELKLSNAKLLRLSELETPELRSVKSTRTKAEYCWTLTPFAPRFVFEADTTIKQVTYVDADLWFRKSPLAVFEEFEASGKSVLITDHAYAPEYDQSTTSGQYCVQFMVFSKGRGELVRKWWEERCIEWCYARFENGLFGDQKYLDDWPTRFKNEVHVMSAQHLVLAPWNMSRFPYSAAFAVHLHGLKISQHLKTYLPIAYTIPHATDVHVYTPYKNDLKKSFAMLASVKFLVRSQLNVKDYWVNFIKLIIKSIFPQKIYQWTRR